MLFRLSFLWLLIRHTECVKHNFIIQFCVTNWTETKRENTISYSQSKTNPTNVETNERKRQFDIDKRKLAVWTYCGVRSENDIYSSQYWHHLNWITTFLVIFTFRWSGTHNCTVWFCNETNLISNPRIWNKIAGIVIKIVFQKWHINWNENYWIFNWKTYVKN